MVEPTPLWVVSGVVVAALVVWVASVLLRPGPRWAAPVLASAPAAAAKDAIAPASSPPASGAETDGEAAETDDEAPSSRA